MEPGHRPPRRDRPRHHQQRVRRARGGVQPDGRLLATGEGDGTARAWNPATRRPVGAPIQACSGPAAALSVMAFSPSGKLLAGGSYDGTVRLWQVSLFAHTDAALCADAGSPTSHEWNHCAFGEPQPKACA